MFRASLSPSSGEQDCVLLHMVFCTGCAGCGCVQLGRKLCALCEGYFSNSNLIKPYQTSTKQKLSKHIFFVFDGRMSAEKHVCKNDEYSLFILLCHSDPVICTKPINNVSIRGKSQKSISPPCLLSNAYGDNYRWSKVAGA